MCIDTKTLMIFITIVIIVMVINAVIGKFNNKICRCIYIIISSLLIITGIVISLFIKDIFTKNLYSDLNFDIVIMNDFIRFFNNYYRIILTVSSIFTIIFSSFIILKKEVKLQKFIVFLDKCLITIIFFIGMLLSFFTINKYFDMATYTISVLISSLCILYIPIVLKKINLNKKEGII